MTQLVHVGPVEMVGDVDKNISRLTLGRHHIMFKLAFRNDSGYSIELKLRTRLGVDKVKYFL